MMLLYSRAAAVAIYTGSIIYANLYPNPINYQPWGPIKYMTFWNVVLQTLFLAFSVVTQNILRLDTVKPFCDLVFFSLTFPVALFVGVTFWGLYAINRELIFPKTHDQFVPRWSTHVKHTLIVVMVVLELVLGDHTIPDHNSGLKVLLSFMTAYIVMVLYLAHTYQFWVYPILAKLNWPYRASFFGVLTFLVYTMFLLGMETKRIMISPH